MFVPRQFQVVFAFIATLCVWSAAFPQSPAPVLRENASGQLTQMKAWARLDGAVANIIRADGRAIGAQGDASTQFSLLTQRIQNAVLETVPRTRTWEIFNFVRGVAELQIEASDLAKGTVSIRTMRRTEKEINSRPLEERAKILELLDAMRLEAIQIAVLTGEEEAMFVAFGGYEEETSPLPEERIRFLNRAAEIVVEAEAQGLISPFTVNEVFQNAWFKRDVEKFHLAAERFEKLRSEARRRTADERAGLISKEELEKSARDSGPASARAWTEREVARRLRECLREKARILGR
jgi:hypothetical protein